MIPVSDPVLFGKALNALASHKSLIGREFKGRFIQLFLALKFYQNSIPSMYSGSFINSGLLQGMVDDLFAKLSRPVDQCVLSLFENNFLARTGVNGQNTWRNNLNIQKGIGCYAPPAELSSMTFLDEERVDCRYLIPSNNGSLVGAQCSICTSGRYRRESHRKWLRIDPNGNGYAALDMYQVANFEPYIAPSGRRIPVVPLIVALYHDSSPGLALGTRRSVSLAEFMADFNISQAELHAYFDISSSNPQNAALTSCSAWPQGVSVGAPLASSPPNAPPSKQPSSRRSGSKALSGAMVLPPPGTQVPPPVANTGWDAEQFVSSALVSDGWTTHDVSRQQLGYDILATKGRKLLYVEVKSSVGNCSPSLTSGEWERARRSPQLYVLAIVENFNPQSQNTIYWVPDPVNSCVSTSSRAIVYNINRSSWCSAAVTLGQL